MPELADGVALLATFFAAVLCWMLLVGYQLSLGALLRGIASVADSVSLFGWHPFRVLGSLAHQVDQYINAALVDAVNGTRWAFAKVLNFTALLIERSFEAVAELAEGTYLAIAHVITHDIPLGFKREFAPYLYLLNYLRKQVGQLAHQAAHVIEHTTTVVQRETTKVVQKVERVTRVEVVKQAAAIPKAIGIPLPRVGALERDVSGIGKRVEDALRKLSPAALAGVFVGSILSVAGLQWIRCGNVGRTGKALCGLNANVLEGLLAGLLSIFGTIGIVTFAKDVQKVVGDFGGEIGHFWRADVIGGGAIVVEELARELRDRAGIDELTVSEHDILDGIVLSIAE